MITELAPDCFIRGAFSCSRTEATIQASALSWRTVSVASTLESSRSVVMMTCLACSTPGALEDLAAGRVAGDDGEAVGVGVGDRVAALVDHDDRVAARCRC